MCEPDLNQIVLSIMNAILNDQQLCFPWYRDDIKTETQANSVASTFPLIYVWNEVVEGGMLKSFSLSVNGSIISAMLEKKLPRTHPAFPEVHDHILQALSKTQNETVIDICKQFKCRPSRLSQMLLS